MSGFHQFEKAKAASKGQIQRAISDFQATFIKLPERGAPLSQLYPDPSLRLRHLVVLWIFGAIALGLVTFICLGLGLNFATAAFSYLIVVVLLSLLDSLISSAIFSAIAFVCLDFFFVEPRFTWQIDHAQDFTTLIAFLATSFVITGLVRGVRRFGEVQREQARLLNLTQDAVVVRDMDDVITFWTRGAEALYGWEQSEAVGKMSHELLRTAFPAPIEEIEETLRQSGRWEGELLHTTRDGRQLSVASRWSLQLNERGTPIGTLESNIDITERKRVEDALRRNQAAYLAEAQKLSHTGSFGWNVTSGELFWSEETFRIFEYDPRSNPNVELVLKRVHPDDRARVQQVIDRAAKHMEGFDFEHRLLMPDSSIKHLRVVAHALNEGPGNFVFVGAVMDVTAQRKAAEALRNSEQRYRHLFQYVPIGLAQCNAARLNELFEKLRAEGVTDLSAYLDEHPEFLHIAMHGLVVERVNERTIKMFGASREADLLGPVAPYWQARPDTYRRLIEARFRGDQLFEEETNMMTFDGRVIDVHYAVARVAGANMPGISLVGLIDITERVRAQQRLQQVEADFAHAARISTLGELVASIAHELKQPLAAITISGEAGLQWLNRPEPDLDEARKLTARMVADARRSADIIGRIRAMAVRRAPEQTPVSLDELIREALLFLRHEVQSRDVTISHYRGPAEAKVLADRTQLQQVLVNLALNAMQSATQAKGAEGRITIRTTAPDAATLCCTVEDSGPGILPDHFSRLFDSFFTTKDNGMGMGLSVCRSIIEAHGGSIAADNGSVHGGARFLFTLPSATVRREGETEALAR